MLEKSCKKFMLFREANELQQWIGEKEGALTNEEVGSDLEQVEVLQKKFDDFQKVRPTASVIYSSLNPGGTTDCIKVIYSSLNLQRLMLDHGFQFSRSCFDLIDLTKGLCVLSSACAKTKRGGFRACPYKSSYTTSCSVILYP